MVKKASEYSVSKRRDGRFQVKKRGGGFINGNEKAQILHKEKKIKLTPPKPKEAAAEGGEAPAEG